MLRKVSGLVVRSCTAHITAKGQLWEQPRLQLIQDLTDTANLHDAYLAQYRCCPALWGPGRVVWGQVSRFRVGDLQITCRRQRPQPAERMRWQGRLQWLSRLQMR